MTFLIRLYHDGKMSRVLKTLAIRDTIRSTGPLGSIWHCPLKNHLRLGPQTLQGIKKLGFIAGGTGITPILSILRSWMQEPVEKTCESTEIILLYANRTEDDILLQDGIKNERLAACDITNPLYD